MGFVKFSRVFRFIGLFLGLNILVSGLALVFMDQIPGFKDQIIEAISATEGGAETVEQMLAMYVMYGWGLTIVGGFLVVFGIICFIVFGVKKDDLEASSYSSSSYNSNYVSSSSYSYSSSNSSNRDKSYIAKEAEEYLRVDVVDGVVSREWPDWLDDYEIHFIPPRNARESQYDFIILVNLMVYAEEDKTLEHARMMKKQIKEAMYEDNFNPRLGDYNFDLVVEFK